MDIAQPLVGAGSYYGKYFLLEKLATGGMGEVFLARQQGPAGFEKILVVKKILNHLTENKEFVELFLGEARLAARMNHPNVVQVFELGEQQGTYFIAMEYVHGKSLREVIDAAQKRKERIHPEIARAIAEQICDGASYAHNLTDITGRSLNIIHRDLNPQNVLLGFGGDVKVIDFGIAKSEISTVKTEAGMIKGKFVYMSPEQSLAKPLDKRSDVFAIGITLYEMLCGQNPFHRTNIVLALEAIQRSEPLPPSEWDPALAPFDPILAKALAKDRERRYADASEMQEDLRRIVLPRAPERLTAFLARLFRARAGDEQKAFVDSDSWKITGSRDAPRTPPSTALANAGDLAGASFVVVNGATRKEPAARGASPRPSPRPPPPPPRKPGTAEPAAAEMPAGEVRTEVVSSEDVQRVVAARTPPRAAALPPAEPAPVEEPVRPLEGKSTDPILKIPRAPSAPIRRIQMSGRALWVAFGSGIVASVVAIAAIVAWGLVDERPAPRLRRTALAGIARAEKAPRPYGTLWLDAKGGAVRFAGAAVAKQSSPYELPLSRDGSVEIEDAHMGLHLDFARSTGALEVRVQGSPGAVVWLNGVSRGPAPIAGLKLAGQETLLELRKPGTGSALSLRLRYREN